MSTALRFVLLLVVVACAYLFLAHPYWFPAGASATSDSIDRQFRIAFWVFGALFVLGHLVLIYVLSKRPHADGKIPSGSWRLEITWTLAITIIFFWFNISGEHLWSRMMPANHMMAAEKQPGEIEIEVTGAQFQWYFRYPGSDGVFGRTDAQKFAKPAEGNALGIDPGDPAGRDDILATAMVVPVGRDVHLHLRAQDVVHSLFIPAMRFKQDTVPGMEIHSHFTPTQIGNYEIACAELCGLGHYRMRALVRVVSKDDFEKWIKAQEAAASR
ncbi:MAG TPA: cytochrome C oxidase subunit II [Candidatus Angelobacter sp.]|jgi:cytochrome c oxidase subunit 2|nr:cytochrome C oxidase subunit II [Candidatus Angelobacter sp.]